MALKKGNIYADKVALFEKLVEGFKEVELKGDANPYTSLNGNMYSILSSDGVFAIRLPEGEREAFIKKYKTTLKTAYGIVQKEYVVVPDALLKKTPELKKYFQASLAYVKTLKPKATTKKSK